jgi:acetyl esterase/lipase
MGGSIPLLLDVYQPDQSCTTPRPTVMFVHGGGFTEGSRKGANVEAIAAELAPLGINLISIQYRLQGNAPIISSEFSAFESDYQNLIVGQTRDRITAFVAAVEDSVRALRWIQSNASQYCVDAGRLGLWGSSAGAITVLHVAYSLNPYGIVRPQPRVVIDYWGSLVRDSDLETGEPPLFVLHGTADATVLFAEATELTNRARQVGVPFTFYTVTGGGHGFDGIGFDQRTIDGQSLAKRTASFVDAHLRAGGLPTYESRTIP